MWFWCDKWFFLGHRYKQKTLQVLWVMDEESEKAFPTKDQTPNEYELVDGPVSSTLCMSSLVGFCSPYSMEVCSKINY